VKRTRESYQLSNSKNPGSINGDLYSDAAGRLTETHHENSLCVFGNANSEDPIKLLKDNT